VALILVDKSGFVRDWGPHVGDAEPCFCAVTRMEILYSARSEADYAERAQDLDAFRDLRMDAATFVAAESIQRVLARTGEHRIAISDLLIGACAQQHGADVLHRDKHFDLLAGIFGFRSIRV